MDLVAFDADRCPAEARGYLDAVDAGSKEGLAFGILARSGTDFVGHVLLTVRPVSTMLVGALDVHDFGGQATAQDLLEAKREGFVLTFAVDPAHRRKGVGTRLQQAAIVECRARGLHQIRGWCSLDHRDVYRLKLRLGFAAVPGHQYIERLGQWVPGTYFVLPLSYGL